MKKLLLPLLLAATAWSFVPADGPLPEKNGWVNDKAGIFTPEQETELDNIIKAHDKSYDDELYVLTIDTLAPGYLNLVSFADAIFDEWKIGGKEQKGVLMIYVTKMRGVRIVTGTGVQAKLSKDDTKEIIDQTVIPELKKKNPYQGMKRGAEMVLKFLENN